jgi:hypothetical protein
VRHGIAQRSDAVDGLPESRIVAQRGEVGERVDHADGDGAQRDEAIEVFERAIPVALHGVQPREPKERGRRLELQCQGLVEGSDGRIDLLQRLLCDAETQPRHALTGRGIGDA